MNRIVKYLDNMEMTQKNSKDNSRYIIRYIHNYTLYTESSI